MKHRLRTAMRSIRDLILTAPWSRLLPLLATVIVVPGVLALGMTAAFGSAPALTVVAGLIGLACLCAVSALWVTLARQLRAMRASAERVEVTQRRILAAVEQQRLTADERHHAAISEPAVPAAR
jgi:ABC-type transport system involved in cytochrome bd biosynthesis fused ATPase/permease subunit